MEINKIYNENCIDTLSKMPNSFIDLVITSPPYDNLRDYESNIDVPTIAHELFRVVKPKGVVVWIVGDAVINRSETGTSFKHALEFIDNGFKLHDTMIYEKNSPAYPARANGNRYSQIFEYMFVFSIDAPKTANLIIDKPNKWAGHKDFSGKLKNPVPDFSPRNNIWKYTTSFNDKTGHPAVFPEQLVSDHINTWSNEGDLIYDCFMGSGTTAKMAKQLGRNYIGSEISSEYCKIIDKRLNAE
jgi:DNA modification methylase